jgi:hypothetical protein
MLIDETALAGLAIWPVRSLPRQKNCAPTLRSSYRCFQSFEVDKPGQIGELWVPRRLRARMAHECYILFTS